ncbi:PC4 and SFRS1-interacting protein [Homalodisca vitripennis]|nr:PC4 and SFRS1-interacting protein [Homalodisca vitripennis]
MTHTVMYSQDNTKFLTGDVVFVKVKGYPEWPALVNEIDKTTKTPKYKVTCFGTKDIVKARETDIWLYAENIHKCGQKKTQSTRNNKFNQALIEAEEYYLENIQSTKETGNTLKTDIIKNHCCIDETPKEIQVHTSSEPLEELERSLLQNDFQDEENNLQMAAKIGAMLLEKNNLLKDENLKLKLQLTSLEGIIEEHEHKEENYILKIENLQQIIADAEKQVENGKDQFANIQRIFEDHDKDQMALIDDYENKIKKQDSVITSLKKQLQKLDDNSKQLSHCETQTEPILVQTANTPSIQTLTPNSFLLTELAQLKLRQDKNSDVVKTCNKKLNDTGETSPSSTLYSVSLQVAKAMQKTNTVELTLENSYSKVKWNKKPPINAKVKLKEESYESFFVKHISFYKECMMKGYNHKEALSDSLLVNGVPPVPTSTHQLLIQQPKTQDSISLHIETKNTVITEHSGPLNKTNFNFVELKPPQTAPV